MRHSLCLCLCLALFLSLALCAYISLYLFLFLWFFSLNHPLFISCPTGIQHPCQWRPSLQSSLQPAPGPPWAGKALKSLQFCCCSMLQYLYTTTHNISFHCHDICMGGPFRSQTLALEPLGNLEGVSAWHWSIEECGLGIGNHYKATLPSSHHEKTVI